MAYDGNKLSIIAATIEGVFNTGVLIGTDDIDTVLTANYISDGQKRGLPKGCTVWYFDGTDVFDCFVSAVEAAPGFGVTLSEIGGGSTPFDLTITDGTHTVANVNHILFVGPVVSGTSPNGVVTVSAGAAAIIPESGPTPIKISGFTDSPTPMGPVGRATGIMPDGDDFLNFNFTQHDLLSGRPGTGDSVYAQAGSSSGSAGSYAGLWTVKGGYGDGVGSFGGAAEVIGGGASGTTGFGGNVQLIGGDALHAGSVFAVGGYSDTDSGGRFSAAGGDSGSGDAGDVSIKGGESFGSGVGTGGTLTLLSGLGDASTGDIIIGAPSSNSANTAHDGGNVTIYSAGSAHGNGGALLLQSGDVGDGGPGYTSGGITLQVGQAPDGADGGPMYFLGGVSGGNASGPSFGGGTGGLIEVRAGGGGNFDTPAVGHGTGGDLGLYSGFGVGTGHVSGNITIRVGNVADSATLGFLFIRNLPTSSSGVPSGGVWLNSNVMTIVP